jgi:uncharacterized membrane protein YgcG
MLRLPALIPALLVSGAALAQEAAPVETVPVWQALVMLLFLLLAALIVVSVLSRLVIALGLVPMKPKTRFHRALHWLARVVGNIERKESRRRTASSTSRGGGGSFGGGGSSGHY